MLLLRSKLALRKQLEKMLVEKLQKICSLYLVSAIIPGVKYKVAYIH